MHNGAQFYFPSVPNRFKHYLTDITSTANEMLEENHKFKSVEKINDDENENDTLDDDNDTEDLLNIGSSANNSINLKRSKRSTVTESTKSLPVSEISSPAKSPASSQIHSPSSSSYSSVPSLPIVIPAPPQNPALPPSSFAPPPYKTRGIIRSGKQQQQLQQQLQSSTPSNFKSSEKKILSTSSTSSAIQPSISPTSSTGSKLIFSKNPSFILSKQYIPAFMEFMNDTCHKDDDAAAEEEYDEIDSSEIENQSGKQTINPSLSTVLLVTDLTWIP